MISGVVFIAESDGVSHEWGKLCLFSKTPIEGHLVRPSGEITIFNEISHVGSNVEAQARAEFKATGKAKLGVAVVVTNDVPVIGEGESGKAKVTGSTKVNFLVIARFAKGIRGELVCIVVVINVTDAEFCETEVFGCLSIQIDFVHVDFGVGTFSEIFRCLVICIPHTTAEIDAADFGGNIKARFDEIVTKFYATENVLGGVSRVELIFDFRFRSQMEKV